MIFVAFKTNEPCDNTFLNFHSLFMDINNKSTIGSSVVRVYILEKKTLLYIFVNYPLTGVNEETRSARELNLKNVNPSTRPQPWCGFTLGSRLWVERLNLL